MTSPQQVRSIAGGIAITGAVGVAIFQALLALGLPLGKAAWGGSSAELSVTLRISSAIAVGVWLAIASVFATRAGFLRPAWMSMGGAVCTTWAVFGLLCVGCLLNWASRSPTERNIWGPITTILVISTFLLARSERPDAQEEVPLMIAVPESERSKSMISRLSGYSIG
ncbi:expressed unknown protein [Seminavis robusta]|uniref:Uncharacterized protein n=1 Tax=Seminavis robusta TaxID=568900 RepID=A0A9N8H9R0_9STRA|nr:expressed unknown protein [Seminavis robusta]|eukprot:Sro200_g084700.1 n/a (168) ;mRNA; f:39796-40299